MSECECGHSDRYHDPEVRNGHCQAAEWLGNEEYPCQCTGFSPFYGPLLCAKCGAKLNPKRARWARGLAYGSTCAPSDTKGGGA